MAFINTALLRIITAADGLRARLSDERGQDLIEYGLLSGLLAVAIIAGFLLFPAAITAMTDAITECIDFDNVCP
jgi:Flp pilus assembly pilin Flp